MDSYQIGHETITATEQTAIISIAKWRMGEKGEFEMMFRGDCNRFEDKGTNFAPMPEFGSQIIGFRNNNEIPF